MLKSSRQSLAAEPRELPDWGARPWPRPPVQEVGRSASRPPGAGDPLQGPQPAPFEDTARRFAMFGWSNDLGIQRNKVLCVRIEDSFARFKNRFDPTSVLREKPRKPMDAR